MPEYQPESPSNQLPLEEIQDMIDTSRSDKARMTLNALLGSVENVVDAAFDPLSQRDLYTELKLMKLALTRYEERGYLDMEF